MIWDSSEGRYYLTDAECRREMRLQRMVQYGRLYCPGCRLAVYYVRHGEHGHRPVCYDPPAEGEELAHRNRMEQISKDPQALAAFNRELEIEMAWDAVGRTERIQ